MKNVLVVGAGHVSVMGAAARLLPSRTMLRNEMTQRVIARFLAAALICICSAFGVAAQSSLETPQPVSSANREGTVHEPVARAAERTLRPVTLTDFNGANGFFTNSVGIGSGAFTEKLEIIGQSTGSTGAVFGKLRDKNAQGTGAWLVQSDGNDGNAYQAEFGVRGSSRGSYGALLANDGYMYSNGNFTFMADRFDSALKFASGGNTERMRIDAAGNVGIGMTAASGHMLEVNGNVTIHGIVTGTNIQASYQDVAEWVPATETMAPGTVVVLNRKRNNEVTAATEAYDTRVAGVVSAQPGITLGVESASKAKIATTGRVKVRVDATSHPIEIGDLLVTSSRSGTAMRSEPLDLGGVKIHRPGTLIGKALEPLQSGQGEILVLLSLQ